MGVVVVEDSKSDAQLILEGLRRNGRDVSVLLFTDGERASNYFEKIDDPYLHRAERPDLILLDLDLPKKDGAELIGEIRSMPELKNVPVVVFSRSQSREDVWRCYELGANLVIPKPMDAGPFISAVEAIEHYCLDVLGPKGDFFGGLRLNGR